MSVCFETQVVVLIFVNYLSHELQRQSCHVVVQHVGTMSNSWILEHVTKWYQVQVDEQQLESFTAAHGFRSAKARYGHPGFEINFKKWGAVSVFLLRFDRKDDRYSNIWYYRITGPSFQETLHVTGCHQKTTWEVFLLILFGFSPYLNSYPMIWKRNR